MAPSAQDQIHDALNDISSQNEFKRKRGVEVLGSLGVVNEHTLRLLIDIQNTDSHEVVRKAAAHVLSLPAFRAAIREATEPKKTYHAKRIMERLRSGKPVFLYESVYLPVDSRILEQPVNTNFNIEVIQRMGLYGWDVIAVVPRTEGIGLTNTSVGSVTGQTWGGGVGGNVVGVHIIVRRKLEPDNLADAEEVISQYLGNAITM